MQGVVSVKLNPILLLLVCSPTLYSCSFCEIPKGGKEDLQVGAETQPSISQRVSSHLLHAAAGH